MTDTDTSPTPVDPARVLAALKELGWPTASDGRIRHGYCWTQAGARRRTRRAAWRAER